jgi:hypothetical protein
VIVEGSQRARPGTTVQAVERSVAAAAEAAGTAASPPPLSGDNTGQKGQRR